MPPAARIKAREHQEQVFAPWLLSWEMGTGKVFVWLRGPQGDGRGVASSGICSGQKWHAFLGKYCMK